MVCSKAASSCMSLMVSNSARSKGSGSRSKSEMLMGFPALPDGPTGLSRWLWTWAVVGARCEMFMAAIMASAGAGSEGGGVLAG